MRGLLGRLAKPHFGRAASCAIASVAVLFALTGSPAAFQLITPEEAALPAGTIPVSHPRGSPTRRPTIDIVWPSPSAGLVRSPLELKVRFRAFGGGAIDPDTVVLTYLKQPPIDITQRVMPFIKADGINISEAEVPPGLHKFWIELKDKDGRVGGTEFTFQVAK